MTPTPAQLGDVVQQNRYCLNCHQKESQRSTSQELNTNGKRKSIKGPLVAKLRSLDGKIASPLRSARAPVCSVGEWGAAETRRGRRQARPRPAPNLPSRLPSSCPSPRPLGPSVLACGDPGPRLGLASRVFPSQSRRTARSPNAYARLLPKSRETLPASRPTVTCSTSATSEPELGGRTRGPLTLGGVSPDCSPAA